MSFLEVLGLAYGLSEFAMAARKRSGAGARSHDRGTLPLVWVALGAGLAAGIGIARNVELGRFELTRAASVVAIVLLAGGIVLRWWAIHVLGRFFTVDVAIHEGHELVTRGPYRVLRHPSYTGALLSFAGIGLTFGNWLALAALLAPVVAALVVRIHVEEQALSGQFGEAWREHAARTWRLVPFVW